jgi:hypothetical protein
VAEELSEVLWAHEPPQFTTHADCEHVVLLGHVQFPMLCPDCPRVNSIPASIRTNNINAIFLKSNTHSFFLEPDHKFNDLRDTREHMTVWF